MKPCPDFRLALPVYDANDAVRLVKALQDAIDQIREVDGEEMGELLATEHLRPFHDVNSDEDDLPF